MDLKNQEYYDSGFEDGKQQAKAAEQSARNTAGFLKLTGVLAFLCFIYSSALLASYLILHNTAFYDGLAGWEKPISIITLAYLISCLVFFLKGIMIVMKTAKKWGWVTIWLVCFMFICLLPSIAIYFMLELSLGPSIPAGRTGISHYKFWSLAVAVLAGAIIYNRYGYPVINP